MFRVRRIELTRVSLPGVLVPAAPWLYRSPRKVELTCSHGLFNCTLETLLLAPLDRQAIGFLPPWNQTVKPSVSFPGAWALEATLSAIGDAGPVSRQSEIIFLPPLKSV